VPTYALDGPSGFTPLGVPDLFAAVLQVQGITQPYPIQSATIPDAIAGRDILGRGRTGSGKTLAFCLPMVTRLSRPGTTMPARRSPRGLVLVPTRELAAQVMATVRPLAEAAGLDVTLVIGGASYDKQTSRLAKGTDIVVATPGRLYDLTQRGAADLSNIGTVVIDEADQMADLGFLPQVEVLLDQVPARGQRLLFSATLDRAVQALVDRYLRDPREHATDPGTASVDTMDHRVVVLPHAAKPDRAVELARQHGRTIVFVRTRESVEALHEHFASVALRSDMIHGGLSQRARQRALDGFRQGRTQVLVATDVAARGIHVDGVDLVLQLDVPQDHKDYLHRAGRTARAGARGTVVTFVAPTQQRTFARLLDSAGVAPEFDVSRRPGRPRRYGSRDAR
jgi:superfamily II DNA/RNA helicase